MRMRWLLLAGLATLLFLPKAWAAPAPETQKFRVCADPNDLPFSNETEQGFENKLAAFVADKLHESVSYTWRPQRRGFVRNTLKAGLCDVIMGVPTALDMVETTGPYYRSEYVFVSRKDRNIDISAMTDPRLRHLRIGVQLIGDDGFNTPPAHALGREGIVNGVVGFSVYGNYSQPNPAARIITAVAEGKIDLAAAWGPMAGYFAGKSPVPLRLTPIADTAQFQPLQFQYSISMGVRKGDHARKAKLDAVIAQYQPEIDALLKSYGVPLAQPDSAVATPVRASVLQTRGEEHVP